VKGMVSYQIDNRINFLTRMGVFPFTRNADFSLDDLVKLF